MSYEVPYHLFEKMWKTCCKCEGCNCNPDDELQYYKENGEFNCGTLNETTEIDKVCSLCKQKIPQGEPCIWGDIWPTYEQSTIHEKCYKRAENKRKREMEKHKLMKGDE